MKVVTKPTAAAAKQVIDNAKSGTSNTKFEELKVEQTVGTDESTFERVFARYQQAQQDMLEFFGTPGWKRTCIACIAAFCTSFGLCYIGGTLLGYMLVGAVAAGSGMFLQIMIAVIGIIICIRFSYDVGVRIGGAVLTGEADDRAIAAYDAMKGLVQRFNPFGKKIVTPVAS